MSHILTHFYKSNKTSKLTQLITCTYKSTTHVNSDKLHKSVLHHSSLNYIKIGRSSSTSFP